jgi:PAS domain S-box-containing protein
VGNKESDYVEDDIKLVAGLADLAWDIVVRKRAEEALVESRRHLASTLANLPGMVFRCANDENWTFRFASESCRDLTGYDEHDLIGNRTISYAALIHPDDRPAVNDVVQEGIRENSSYQVTYRIIPREGPVKWVWEQGRGVTREGQVREIEGFIYDITDQVEAQQKRQAIEKKILESQKLESLGVLAGGIAHDFNNLLQAMLGFSEMIGVQIGPDHPAQQSLARVTEAASRAADLTRQMLAFSGRGQFSVSRVDLSRQVEAMANLLESSLPKSVSFHRELGADLPQVKLDTAQFQQVVMNMITNAAEAIGDQPGTIHLRTGACQCDAHYLARSVVTGEMGSDPPEPGTYAYVEVQDSGCGMDQATIGRIFEPFFTTKFTGRGLGLAAVQGIMRGHAGALLIDSQVGIGTTIRALFPAVATAGQGGAPVQVPPGAEDHSKQPLILVVEDEATVRQLVTSTLRGKGYTVAEATDGLEALEFMRRKGHQVEGILLDVVMPNMGGEEFLKNVREMKFMTRVILMSGFTREEMMARFGGHEIVDYLAKPFRARQLLDVVSATVPAPRS